MHICALVGPSGTGKSYRAQMVAGKNNINYIIDDGLLIRDNEVIAGNSAKKAPTKIETVKHALFLTEEEKQEIVKAIKKYRPQKSNKVYDKGENLLNRDFSTTKINEKWVADITYIHTLRHGWTYLASILDLHTKKIVGYSYSKTMDTSIVLKALDNAIAIQKPDKVLIIQ